MKSKIISKRKLLLISLAEIFVIAALFSYFMPKKNDQDVSMPSAREAVVPLQQTSYGLPMRLKISRINVDSAVEHVGLTASGAMDVPKNQDNVAWYSPGQRPGGNGSAVIAGHFDKKNGRPAVFYNLDKLQKGDKISVEDSKGEIITFLVRESRSYDSKADTTNVFISNDGKTHLNLITCEGSWNNVSKSYSKRLVVFTDKE